MTFLRYPHLERYGNQEVADIDFGICHIFPKLDGTNASVWYEKSPEGWNKIVCGSRNRQLNWKLSTPEKVVDDSDKQSDNAGFALWMREQTHIHTFLYENPNIVLYGEWLVPHTIKNYRDDAWRKFYVFDVYDKYTEKFLSYDNYQGLLHLAGIEYIPCLQTIRNPSYDNLICAAKEFSKYLMKDGQTGEGIVIKNYEWKNKYNRITWAKIVNSEFKEQNAKEFGPSELINVSNAEKIVEKCCTKTLVEKEYTKILMQEEGWSSRLIPKLLHTVYYSIVTEELWNCLKTINKGSVNFRELEHLCFKKIKTLKPEIFS